MRIVICCLYNMGACCVSTKNSSNDIKKEGQFENEENEKLEVVKSKKMNDNPKKGIDNIYFKRMEKSDNFLKKANL